MCKARLTGQYKVTLPLAQGFEFDMSSHRVEREREQEGRNYTLQEKLRLALGQHIRTYSCHFTPNQKLYM